MKILYFFESLWALLWGLPRNGLLLLVLPLHVAIAGEIVIVALMILSHENRERLLISAILLPLHAVLYLLVFHPPWEFFIEIYVFSAPVLALGLIVYLICLCRWKRMNRWLWTAVAVWILYFASVGSPILFLLLLGRSG